MPIEFQKLASHKTHVAGIYALCKGFEDQTVYSGGGDRRLVKFNLKNFQIEVTGFMAEATIYALTLFRSKRLLFVGDSNGKVYILKEDTLSLKETLSFHTNGVFDILPLAHKDLLITAGADGCISICALSDYSLIKQIKLSTHKLRKLTLVHNEVVISDGDGSIQFLDLDTLEINTKTALHKSSCNTSVYSEKNQMLITGGRDAHLHFLDSELNFSLVKSIPAHNFAIYDMALNNAETLLFTASRDKSIKAWDVPNFAFLKKVDFEKYQSHTHSVNKILWFEDSQTLVSAGDDAQVMAWKVIS